MSGIHATLPNNDLAMLCLTFPLIMAHRIGRPAERLPSRHLPAKEGKADKPCSLAAGATWSRITDLWASRR